jgi:hypothetical protein
MKSKLGNTGPVSACPVRAMFLGINIRDNGLLVVLCLLAEGDAFQHLL